MMSGSVLDTFLLSTLLGFIQAIGQWIIALLSDEGTLLVFCTKDLCEAKHKTASVFQKGRCTPQQSNLQLQRPTTPDQ